jgi:histidine phosphotransfer protein HptB
MNALQWNRDFALEQTAGDEELLEELLTLFRDSSASDLRLLQEAVDKNDPAGVVAAHSIKGASASLGFEGIRQLALAMEVDGRNKSVEVARASLSSLQELLAQLNSL